MQHFSGGDRLFPQHVSGEIRQMLRECFANGDWLSIFLPWFVALA
jgi:hypothetical protein